MSETPITLYEACRRLREEIDEFEHRRISMNYLRGGEEYPLAYPTMAEWARQFRAWKELVETEKIGDVSEIERQRRPFIGGMIDAVTCGVCGLRIDDGFACRDCLKYAPPGCCDGAWASWLERVIDRRVEKALAERRLP